MFIFTWKFSKAKAVILVLLLAAVLCAVILIAGNRDRIERGQAEVASGSSDANDARLDYLSSLGWQVEPEPVETQTVVIPEQLDGVYRQYHELQLSQGFDLSQYAGLAARRYTYKVTNYPGDRDNVVADIIVYRGTIIAGDIQSVALDGFMSGLDYPGG